MNNYELNEELTAEELNMAFDACDGCKGAIFVRDSDCRFDCPVFADAAQEIISQRPEVDCMGCGGEAVETGELRFLCADCRDHLQNFGPMSGDVHIVSRQIHVLLNQMRDDGLSRRAIRASLRAIWDSHLRAYAPADVREQYESQLAEAAHQGVCDV